jgi:hypothetical protein
VREIVAIDLTEASRVAADLNRALKPIADRPVDIDDDNWEEKLRAEPAALDEAGVRDQAESLMNRLLDCYATGTAPERERVREILRQNPAFVWATPIDGSPETAAGFERRLLRLSACEPSADMRDTIVELDEIRRIARQHGVDTVPIMKSVAAVSSDAAGDSIGSFKQILSKRCAK